MAVATAPCLSPVRLIRLCLMHWRPVLVKNHGPFSWGTSPANAVYNAKVMEQCAKMAFIAYQVNPELTMNPLLIEKHYNRKHGPNAYYGQKKK